MEYKRISKAKRFKYVSTVPYESVRCAPPYITVTNSPVQGCVKMGREGIGRKREIERWEIDIRLQGEPERTRWGERESVQSC